MFFSWSLDPSPLKKLWKFFKNDKTAFRQANFCLLRCQILPWHGFVTLVCIYEAWGGLRSPKGGPPPYTWKKLQCLKMIFRPFGAKKIKKIGYGKWPSLTPPSPPSMEFSIIDFFYFFWTLPLPKLIFRNSHFKIHFPKLTIQYSLLKIHKNKT